eukprot:TRINITY_DN1455_c0_g1_i8.p1 TRINITY_DN1455_c0_g1~~TRINITY_DN1455_c0_g1_i8.p1  ORF type:complete len:581 (-),score=129.09 TRINITY_DN1455_c0_g1_i8:53-1795(-)
MSYPGYPPAGGYPAQPGYPAQQAPGYPAQPYGAPPAGQAPYSPQPGYPAHQPAPGYPPQPAGAYGTQPGYPPAGQAYPGAAPGAYPGAAPGAYPGAPSQPGYPGQPQPGYPAQSYPSSYPQAAPGHAPAAAGYPPAGAPPAGQAPYSQPGYPHQPAPGQPPHTAAGYPPAQPGYPPQPAPAGGYPPAAGGYPPQPGYPAAGAPYPGAAPAPYPGAYPGAPAAYPGAAPVHHGAPGVPVAMVPVAGVPAAVAGPSSAAALFNSATYTPFFPFSSYPVASPAAADADALHHAMKGIGTDEAALIRILCKRNPGEIHAIREAYRTKFGKDLVKRVESETSGNFKKVLGGVLTDPDAYQAECLYLAMKGLGTNEDGLIEVLVGKCNAELAMMEKAYEREHKKSIRHALESELSSHLKHLLVGCATPREEGKPVNADAARADAERLYKAGEGKIGTDEKAFVEIFNNRSYAHLRETFRIYETAHKHHSMTHAIESEFSGDLKRCLHAIALFVRNPGEFYAEQLMAAMKGAGTNDAKLIRIVIAQRHNMVCIKAAFAAKYGKSLAHWVEAETSGDYKKALIELIGH